jgi:preprotein translocase subunit SecA
MNFDIRKQLLDFDKVMSKQREAVYRLRNAVLEGEEHDRPARKRMMGIPGRKTGPVGAGKGPPRGMGPAQPGRVVGPRFEIRFEFEKDPVHGRGPANRSQRRPVGPLQKPGAVEQDLGDDSFQQFSRMVLLQVMDTAWVEHLTYLEQLRKGIFLRAYGQKDPLIEFQKEGYNLFETMMQRMREESLEFLFRIEAAPTGSIPPVDGAASPGRWPCWPGRPFRLTWDYIGVCLVMVFVFFPERLYGKDLFGSPWGGLLWNGSGVAFWEGFPG